MTQQQQFIFKMTELIALFFISLAFILAFLWLLNGHYIGVDGLLFAFAAVGAVWGIQFTASHASSIASTVAASIISNIPPTTTVQTPVANVQGSPVQVSSQLVETAAPNATTAPLPSKADVLAQPEGVPPSSSVFTPESQ